MIQQCLVLIKPDGLYKNLTGSIISALSETQLKIVGAKILKVSRELAERHYSELKDAQIKKHGEEKGTKIFQDTIDYLTGKYHADRVLALVYHGENAIEKIRAIAGKTNPEEAEPTSLRGKFGRIHSKTGIFETVIHASDSEKTAEYEIKLWFSPEELAELIYPITESSSQVTKKFWK